MRHMLVQGHMVQKFSNQFPVQAWVEMPLGANPFGVQPAEAGQAIAILALSDPAQPILQFPLCIFPIGAALEVPIGVRPGAFIGHVMLAGGVACVFRGAPWPETVVDTGIPMGTA